jgi:hypothetical protein
MIVSKIKLFQYSALFEILTLKEGAIFRTSFLGHIHSEDEELLVGKFGDSSRYVLSPVSTRYLSQKCDLINLPMWYEKGDSHDSAK